MAAWQSIMDADIGPEAFADSLGLDQDKQARAMKKVLYQIQLTKKRSRQANIEAHERTNVNYDDAKMISDPENFLLNKMNQDPNLKQALQNLEDFNTKFQSEWENADEAKKTTLQDQHKTLELLYKTELVNFQNREFLTNTEYVDLGTQINTETPNPNSAKAEALSRLTTTPDIDSIDQSIFKDDPKQLNYDQTSTEIDLLCQKIGCSDERKAQRLKTLNSEIQSLENELNELREKDYNIESAKKSAIGDDTTGRETIVEESFKDIKEQQFIEDKFHKIADLERKIELANGKKVIVTNTNPQGSLDAAGKTQAIQNFKETNPDMYNKIVHEKSEGLGTTNEANNMLEQRGTDNNILPMDSNSYDTAIQNQADKLNRYEVLAAMDHFKGDLMKPERLRLEDNLEKAIPIKDNRLDEFKKDDGSIDIDKISEHMETFKLDDKSFRMKDLDPDRKMQMQNLETRRNNLFNEINQIDGMIVIYGNEDNIDYEDQKKKLLKKMLQTEQVLQHNKEKLIFAQNTKLNPYVEIPFKEGTEGYYANEEYKENIQKKESLVSYC